MLINTVMIPSHFSLKALSPQTANLSAMTILNSPICQPNMPHISDLYSKTLWLNIPQTLYSALFCIHNYHQGWCNMYICMYKYIRVYILSQFVWTTVTLNKIISPVLRMLIFISRCLSPLDSGWGWPPAYQDLESRQLSMLDTWHWEHRRHQSQFSWK